MKFLLVKKYFLSLLLLCPILVSGQTVEIDFSSMDAFQPVAKNWRVAESVSAPLEGHHVMKTKKGEGILVNLPDNKRRDNLLTVFEHGDIDLEVEFMMAPESNSGIYLQGRYEVQLLDSWGVKVPKYGDLGGIYQRRRPDGSQFEGHPPAVNAAKAPGLWQHMFISFQAPRFDKSGKKVSNAKILKVELNGFVIHENIELTGPTGGPISQEEAARGPIMIQGDHGPVAFRKIKYTLFDNNVPEVTNLRYTVYTGDKMKLNDDILEGLKKREGDASEIHYSYAQEGNEYKYTMSGDLRITKPGEYTFGIQAPGTTAITINDETVVDRGWMFTQNPARTGTIQLAAGMQRFEISYTKLEGWLGDGLAFYISGPGIRWSPLHAPSSFLTGVGPDPILLDANEPTIHRSFSEHSNPDGSKTMVTRAINVGSPEMVHYTYDLGTGSLIKVWRGDFLDVTPMFNSRGNGQSIANGASVNLHCQPAVASLEKTDTIWPAFYNDGEYRSLGYSIDNEYPVFKYHLADVEFEDAIVIKDEKYLTRTITTEDRSGTYYVRLAKGSVQEIETGLYSIDNAQYLIRVSSAEGVEPIIRSSNGSSELIAPISGSITYSIIW